jgi:hypothetical protein
MVTMMMMILRILLVMGTGRKKRKTEGTLPEPGAERDRPK